VTGRAARPRPGGKTRTPFSFGSRSERFELAAELSDAWREALGAGGAATARELAATGHPRLRAALAACLGRPPDEVRRRAVGQLLGAVGRELARHRVRYLRAAAHTEDGALWELAEPEAG
jgi:hypothetical protein